MPPTLRTDVVDVYIFRRGGRVPEFLQLLRADEPLKDTWHPIMGHIHDGESAIQTAMRELHEEAGLAATDSALLNIWALDQVHPFYVARLDCICLSPRFAAEVPPGWQPTLNDEHSAARWVPADDAYAFVWPGQRAAVAEVLTILRGGSLAAELLRMVPGGDTAPIGSDPSA